MTAAVGAAMLLLIAGPAAADNVSIDISTPSVSFGLNIGAPPQLVVVPGLPVQYSPAVPANYFVYGGYYYLFHQGTWFYSHHHNGPWVGLAIHQVPRPLLRVPVKYYKTPPGHAKKAGPPKWVGDGRGKGKHKRR
jgi:hypothetical protein